MSKENGKCCVVTGGGGYPGFSLALKLRKEGYGVRILDVCSPPGASVKGITFIEGSVADYDTVRRALGQLICEDDGDYFRESVSCVYHMASFGMSGRDQLNRRMIEQVNIDGTKNVIKACIELGISRLVYTSTYNVIYGGEPIINGDESLPYFPLDRQPDHYSRTKSIAEQLVLAANGTRLQLIEAAGENEGASTQLSTCALRLAGVYGPGEQRHLPRIVNYLQRGLFSVRYGREDSLVDFLHVDNLVQAHLLAGKALSQRESEAAGQAYFISDCSPINNFEFFRPLIEGLGYKFPTIKIPLFIVFYFALLNELVHSFVGHIYNFQPILTRTEVYKTGVTHYFSNEKAHKELGYEPTVQNDMSSVVRWFIERGYHRNNSRNGLNSRTTSFFRSLLINLLLAFAFVVLLFSFLPYVR